MPNRNSITINLGAARACKYWLISQFDGDLRAYDRTGQYIADLYRPARLNRLRQHAQYLQRITPS